MEEEGVLWEGEVRMGGRTAKRFSLFLDGRVDGENQSFRRIVCLMMFSLLRMAFTRDSAEPEIVSGPGTLSAVTLSQSQS